jgi:hypothetical protein
MSYIVNKVVIEKAESLEDVKRALKIFLSCLIIVRGYID